MKEVNIIRSGKRKFVPRDNGPKRNENIKYEQIRVIDEDGTQLGIMTPAEALEIAASKNLDLIEIAPNANPPVCKIMDYGKYKYELAKKEKEQKKKQHANQVKEIKMRPIIDEHDFNIKAEHAKEFLEHGYKVKLVMMFFGRMLAHTDIGMEKVKKFIELLNEYGTPESEPKKVGNNIIVILAPSKKKKKK